MCMCRAAEVQEQRRRDAEVERSWRGRVLCLDLQSCRGTELQKCRGAEMQMYRGIHVKMSSQTRCTGADVHVQCAEVLKCRSRGEEMVQRCRGHGEVFMSRFTEVQNYRVLEVQRCRGSEVHHVQRRCRGAKCKGAGVHVQVVHLKR